MSGFVSKSQIACYLLIEYEYLSCFWHLPNYEPASCREVSIIPYSEVQDYTACSSEGSSSRCRYATTNRSPHSFSLIHLGWRSSLAFIDKGHFLASRLPPKAPSMRDGVDAWCLPPLVFVTDCVKGGGGSHKSGSCSGWRWACLGPRAHGRKTDLGFDDPFAALVHELGRVAGVDDQPAVRHEFRVCALSSTP